ncbi:zeta toxin family protein [Chryseolinea soli]|uniref:zeta toxin family protein n=1 Tax=Chryseolinea soli TaxID=2321403 RepID=UPI00135BC0F9|nr:zeta toxin family protein [Chryseolinea soli]
MPELHIITGSNGAGKSSIGADYLPTHIKKNYTVFDGDKLTLEKIKELRATKHHSDKETKALANEWIGQHFDEQVKNALSSADHFAYEGHFREASAWKVINKFKRKGYSVHLIFFGLINVERSAMRVFDRAIKGGHNVSLAEIDLNYHGNLLQLDRHFKMLDTLRIIDTSETAPKLLLHIEGGQVAFYAPFHDLPDWFTTYLIKITRYLYPKI